MKRWDVHHCFTLGLDVPVKDGDVLDSARFVRGMKGAIKDGSEVFDVTVIQPMSGRRVCIDGIYETPRDVNRREVLDWTWQMFVDATQHQFAGIMEDHAYNDGAASPLPAPKRPVDPYSLILAESVPKMLDYINAHRRAIGQAPLDPVAAGWEMQDVKAEFDRLRRLQNLMHPAHARVLNRRLR